MKSIGFWNNKNNDYPAFPMVEEFIHPNFLNKETKRKIIIYLESARELHFYKGSSKCRICGKRNGSYELTDGKYIWPSGYVHYIEEHDVVPSKDFLRHIKEVEK